MALICKKYPLHCKHKLMRLVPVWLSGGKMAPCKEADRMLPIYYRCGLYHAKPVCLPQALKPSWCNQTQPICVLTTVILSVLLNHMSVRNAKRPGHHKPGLANLNAQVWSFLCAEMQTRFWFILLLNKTIAKTPEHGWMTKIGTERPPFALTVTHKINSVVGVLCIHRYSTLVSAAQMLDTWLTLWSSNRL